MKRLLAIMVSMVIIFSLVGCTSRTTPDTNTPTPPGETNTSTSSDEIDKIELTFAWCTDNVDVSQQNYYDTAKAYVDYLNSVREDIHITMNMFDGQGSVEKQISDIETAVAMGVDAIILNCVDHEGVTPAVQADQSEGIPVLDRGLGTDGGVCTVYFIGADENIKGQYNYEWTKQYLEEHPDVVLYAGLQQGSTNHPNCFPRMKKMYDLAEEYPDRFIILTEQYGDWSTDTAMKMVEDWLQIYPQMNFISSSNEEQMLGVIEALRGANVLENYVLTAFNGEQAGVEMLKRGEIMMDVGSIMPIYVGLAIETTVKMVLEGQEGVVDVSDKTMYCVTQENVNEYEEMIRVDYQNINYFESTLKSFYTNAAE